MFYYFILGFLLWSWAPVTHSELGRGLTNRPVLPRGMTKNMVYLKEPKLLSFLMPCAYAVYEVNGKKYLVKNMPFFAKEEYDNKIGCIVIKGKEDEEAFKKTGQNFSYNWFSAGKVTKELLEQYKNDKANNDFPLE